LISSSSQEENEEANLCLEVGYDHHHHYHQVMQVLSSKDKNDCYELLHAFEEFHNEAN